MRFFAPDIPIQHSKPLSVGICPKHSSRPKLLSTTKALVFKGFLEFLYGLLSERSHIRIGILAMSGQSLHVRIGLWICAQPRLQPLGLVQNFRRLRW